MINTLIERIKQKGAPIVAGLDPTLKFIPEHILEKAFAEYGETLKGAAEAVWVFNKGIIDNIHDLIPAVKPQIAMYEQFGLPGLEVFKRTVDYCKARDLTVIGDVKRGDIGSTSAAYATAHLGKIKIGASVVAPFDEDFVTVNPYLGTDGVKPFIDVCNEHDKGIFVLVKTSNPSSGEFQDRLLEGGEPLYCTVASKVAEWAEMSMDSGNYSNVGAVVGATYPEIGKSLRKYMPKCFILVPGYGAQGGTGKDLAAFFNRDGLGAIVNSSRGIIAAYQNEKYASFGAENFADAARQAVLDMKADINASITGA
jgi:orotidine-5'-phosphate decarboxylase